MVRARGQRLLWKALLVLPIGVAALVVADGASGRMWRTTGPAVGQNLEMVESSSSSWHETRDYPSGAVGSVELGRDDVVNEQVSENPTPATIPAYANDANLLRAAVGEPGAANDSRLVFSRRGSAKYLARPAPDTVAPSSEVALRISESPPAVTSAPRPAPATTLVAFVPAPEPKVAPTPAPAPVPEMRRPRWSQSNIRAVRFDVGYYYGRGRSARQLADELTRSWSEKGVNLVYFYAYNRVYGARYYTRYPGNIMEDYGRQDLLSHTVRAAHRRGIKVVAWFYGHEHKQAWEAHPEWRQKRADGRDYKPEQDIYRLCVRNPEAQAFWLGFIDDILTRYPELDGIDMAESQVDQWGDNACHCEHCRAQFAAGHPGEAARGATWRKFRANGLTEMLGRTTRLAQARGKEVHITTVFTAGRDGKLMASGTVRDATGFDLEGVLGGSDPPDIVQAELIWQQWAALYRNQSTFSPAWTSDAVRQAKGMVRGRARIIAHVELTDFGSGGLTAASVGATVAAAVRGEPDGVDIYDANLLEKTEGASSRLQVAWLSFSD